MIFKKNTPLIPSFDAPFEGDRLNRESTIRTLAEITNQIEHPFVMTLNSPWGTGKTTFLRMWKAHLESNCMKCHCILFNAWKNDFADKPLISFVAEIQEFIKEKDKGEDLKALAEDIANIAKKMFVKLIPILLKLATSGFVDLTKVKDGDKLVEALGQGCQEVAGDALKEQRETKQLMEEFRLKLTEFATKFKGPTGQPLHFFVDELDRCRPTYAIELLETIKHLFDVPGIVFVLAVDREQLSHTVKAVYGQDFGASGYLKRFIDIEYVIPEPPRDLFIRHLMEDVYKFNEEDGALSNPEFEEAFRIVLTAIAKERQLTLRTIEKIFVHASLLWSKIPDNPPPAPELYIYIPVMRELCRDGYLAFAANRDDWEAPLQDAGLDFMQEVLEMLNDFSPKLFGLGQHSNFERVTSKYARHETLKYVSQYLTTHLIQLQHKPVKAMVKEEILQKLEMMAPFTPTEME